MLKKHTMPLAALVVTLALAACGGGGSVNVGSTGSVPATELSKAMRFQVQTQGDLQNYVLNIDGKSYKAGDYISLSDVKQGFTEYDYTSSGVLEPQGQNRQDKYTGTVQVYKQAYSFIYGDLWKTASFNGKEPEPVNRFSMGGLGGVVTESKNLPQTGNFTYKGVAMSSGQPESRGTLSYNVNFDTKVGNGRIEGIKATGSILLHEAQIMSDKADIGGKAQSDTLGSANYKATFYGPKAEEIAGKVTLGGQGTGFGTTEVGFIGKR